MYRLVTSPKYSTSTSWIPSTSETTGGNASGEVAPAADEAADNGKLKREKTWKYTDNYIIILVF